MATKVWKGGAQATPQVSTVTPGNVGASDTFTLTINGKDITVTATANAADVVDSFVTAINASTIPEWEEATAADGGNTLTLTGPTDGRPITVTGSATGGATCNVAETTAPTGPYHFDNVENWDTGTIPADGDTVVFEESTWPCLYALSQANITPASILVKQSFSGEGKIGLPPYRGSGNTGYWEYRTQYLTLGNAADAQTITVEIGEGDGTGSGRIKLNTGNANTQMRVMNSGSPEGTHPAILWKGTHVGNTLRVYKGSVGVAVFAGETAVIEDLDVGFRTRRDTDSDVVLGRGADVDDIQQSGGSLVIGGETGNARETIVQTGGTLTINGSDGVTSLIVRGGRCYYNSSGTLGGAPVVSGDGVLDFDQDMRAKTVTNPIEVYGDSAKVVDTFKVVTSLVVDFNETTRLKELGTNIRVTRGTPA